MTISQNHNFLAVSKKAEKFFYSDIYIAIVTIIGALGFAFRLELYAIYAIALLGALNWVLCRDLMPSFLAMAIISMTPLSRYGEVGYFIPDILYVIAIIAPAGILRMIIFPPKLTLGRFFVPTLAVAVAVTLGGLFSIKLKDYFAMPALYYTIALGVGMV
ncbi:MAG: hypothetical protein PHC84_04130, partial [Clostridia bacterium]|nr:hypothetical protein [Clostridia bacterium]